MHPRDGPYSLFDRAKYLVLIDKEHVKKSSFAPAIEDTLPLSILIIEAIVVLIPAYTKDGNPGDPLRGKQVHTYSVQCCSFHFPH